MIKLSIRDRWGKLTEKKALNPEMRNMLLRLDGVYEQRPDDRHAGPVEAPAPDADAQRND